MESINNNRQPGKYRFERLDTGKLKDLRVLYKTVYGSAPGKDYFLKKYNTAYTGIEFIGFIAYSQENEPVAFYGVIPCFIQYKNKIVLAAQAADAMTHARHRYRGLFVDLVKTTFDLCKASGIKFIFGFPNQNSYHGLFDKLHWQMKETMNCFIIPVNTFPLEFLLQHFKWTKWIYRQYVKWILHKYYLPEQGFPSSVITPEYGGVYRCDQYLQYKTYNPSHVIRIGKTKIWIRVKNGLVIGDIDAGGNKDNFEAVMAVMMKIAKRLGVARIFFQTSPSTHLHTLFSEKYKPVPSFPVLFLDFGAAISFDKLKFTFADIDIF